MENGSDGRKKRFADVHMPGMRQGIHSELFSGKPFKDVSSFDRPAVDLRILRFRVQKKGPTKEPLYNSR